MSPTPITVLGLETSCDETAAAVVRLTPDDTQAGGVQGDIMSNVVLSQIDLHAPYGGWCRMAARAYRPSRPDGGRRAGRSRCKLEDMDAVAATARPG